MPPIRPSLARLMSIPRTTRPITGASITGFSFNTVLVFENTVDIEDVTMHPAI